MLTPALESLPLDPVKNVAVNKLEQLVKNCVAICHGLILFVY